jgi:hypothetical protein
MSTSRYSDGDVVELSYDLNRDGLTKGLVGTIIESFDHSDVHLVEFDPEDLPEGTEAVQRLTSDLLVRHDPKPRPANPAIRFG